MNIFINLLPEEKKEEAKNLGTIGSFVKTAGVAIFAIILLLVFIELCIFAISLQEETMSNEIKKFENNKQYISAKASQDTLKEYDTKAKQVKKELGSQKDHWSVISEINTIIPEGINLSYFSIEEGKVTLRGIAAERKDFLLLEERFEGSDLLKDVNSPISNFVSEKNAQFEITAILKNGKQEENQN